MSQPLQVFFFFNDTATTEIYTLSLHDALPILTDSPRDPIESHPGRIAGDIRYENVSFSYVDRKSTRLNSSHSQISYAVFCLKKKKTVYISVWRVFNRARVVLPDRFTWTLIFIY